MKPLLTALALLILVAVPAYAWEDGTFLCKPLKFDDGSGSDDSISVFGCGGIFICHMPGNDGRTSYNPNQAVQGINHYLCDDQPTVDGAGNRNRGSTADSFCLD